MIQEYKDRMGRKVKVIVGTPCRLDFNVDARLVTFVLHNIYRGIVSGYRILPSRSAEDGRNLIADWFVNECKDATHILWMDSDTAPKDLFALERLLSHNKPVVAGVTPIYYQQGGSATNQATPDEAAGTMVWNAMLNPNNDGGNGKAIKMEYLPEKPFKVSCFGGTTILVQRKVMEVLTPPYYYTMRDPKTNRITCGEDYYFARKVKEAGFDLWIDPSVECTHGQYVDLLQMRDLCRKGLA